MNDLEGAEPVEVTSVELVVPITGEVLSPDDPESCLRVLAEVREFETKFRQLKAALTEALSTEFARRGTKTIEMNGIKAVLGPDSEIVWDVSVLQELADIGLPEDRMNELVTAEITYKVNANVAKQIAGANSNYAEVIERAKSRVPKTPYVSLKRG
jgi:hypothetical protein